MKYANTRLGISLGDFNGVSLEILLKSFENDILLKHCTPVVFTHKELLQEASAVLNVACPQINIVKQWDEVQENCLNLREIDCPFNSLDLGNSSEISGRYAVSSLKAAVNAIMEGHIHNLVTLPIDKSTSYSEDFKFEGHTDFLGDIFETTDYMMLLVSDEMRIGMVTGHVPISKVAASITTEKIRHKLTILQNSLIQDFGIVKPKIAVLGLNPHSGDHGLIGREEKDIITPVINEFIQKGDLVYGPFPADGFFGKKLFSQYDAVLAMYHDQGLIPFKQLSFSDGVNYTAGLPIVRTSPDHGTAYDIAGKSVADPSSFINAIFLTKHIYNKRIEFMELNNNPLGFTKHRREKFSIGVPNLK